jgi:hypothetical protein
LNHTWRGLNVALKTLDEQKVLEMLNHERATESRASILRRIHQRYNTLRVSRERIELLQEAKQP